MSDTETPPAAPWAVEPPVFVHANRRRTARFDTITVDQIIMPHGRISPVCLSHVGETFSIRYAEQFHATYAAALELARKWGKDAGKKAKDVKWE